MGLSLNRLGFLLSSLVRPIYRFNSDANYAEATFQVQQGDRTAFALRMVDDQYGGPPMDTHQIEQGFVLSRPLSIGTIG